jgi:hypothetical protein
MAAQCAVRRAVGGAAARSAESEVAGAGGGDVDDVPLTIFILFDLKPKRVIYYERYGAIRQQPTVSNEYICSKCAIEIVLEIADSKV